MFTKSLLVICCYSVTAFVNVFLAAINFAKPLNKLTNIGLGNLHKKSSHLWKSTLYSTQSVPCHPGSHIVKTLAAYGGVSTSCPIPVDQLLIWHPWLCLPQRTGTGHVQHTMLAHYT